MGSVDRYKSGFFFSPEFIGDNSWNGYEHNLLFESVGDGQFADVARPLGCDAIEDSRGVAIADLNNDGKLDIVVNNNNAAPALYVNRGQDAGHWLRVKLIGACGSNRDAIGARVKVVVEKDGQPHSVTRWVEAGTGYAAQSDVRLHFGLGDSQDIESMTIAWPNGDVQDFTRAELAGALDKTIQVKQGIWEIAEPPIPAEAKIANSADHPTGTKKDG